MAAALVDYGRMHSIEPKPEDVEEFRNFPGEGIQGRIEVKNIYIGNRKITHRASGTGKKPLYPSNKLVEVGFRGVLNALVLCSYSANNSRR